MNRYQEEYNRKKMSARQVLENIQSRDFVFTPMAASVNGEPSSLCANQVTLKSGDKATFAYTTDKSPMPDPDKIMDYVPIPIPNQDSNHWVGILRRPDIPSHQQDRSGKYRR